MQPVIAKRFHSLGYYRSMQYDIRNVSKREKEKIRLRTSKKEDVDLLIEKYKEKAEKELSSMNNVLDKIYKKNNLAAMSGAKAPIHTNLFNLICNPTMLLLSYKSIKSNKGAMTAAYIMSHEDIKKLDKQQRDYIKKTFKTPDGISLKIINTTIDLLKKDKYPWGVSRRIYIDKPGTDKKRPLTIPPFMDRIIQTAIKTLLEAIYEPWFEKQNRSFGFRTNKGVHDAIYSLIRPYTKTMQTAIEGDIKSAYDKVNRDIFINILKKRIKDDRLVNLIINRLKYKFFDTQSKKYVTPTEGIPQGGTDSPYLWNIYICMSLMFGFLAI
jgi:hypothetical protein